VRVASITVGADALTAVLRFEPGEPLRTTPEIARRALALLPGLARHHCDNDAGLTFAAEARDTEIAHLLEHVACELMALSGSRRTLRGETAWDFGRDGCGVFRVTLQYDDDLVALGALKTAAEVVSALVAGEEPPDVGAAAERLRGLHGGG
jgi:hypothetical protein